MVHPVSTAMRRTGLDHVEQVPWGTHLCQFYSSKQDLLDVVVPFLKAGLDANELCLWVVSDPLTENAAKAALRKAIPGFERHQAERRIEIHPHTRWYLKGAALDLERTAQRWRSKLDEALARGHAGLRISGCTAWLSNKDQREFWEYERSLGASMARRRMIALCTYPLAESGAHDLLDVASAHGKAFAMRQGQWEVLATAARRATPGRTSAGGERARLFDQVSAGREQLQALSRRLLHTQETERRAIARELHDEIGQLLTGLSLTLAISPNLPARKALARLGAAQRLVHGLIKRVQDLVLDLRPALLDELGLTRSLMTYIERYTNRTGVSVKLDGTAPPGRRFAPEIETAAYRIIQEALTNVARYASVSEVLVRLQADSRVLSLAVEDRGRGFDPASARTDASSGLTGMHERASLLGGSLTIDSAPGAGTRIRAVLPLHDGPEARPRKGRAGRAPGRSAGAKALSS
jgi:signal transduction histidine kinase